MTIKTQITQQLAYNADIKADEFAEEISALSTELADDVVVKGETTTAGIGFVLDEDSMASDSATKLATQQSIKAYVDAQNKVSAARSTDGAIATSGLAVLTKTSAGAYTLAAPAAGADGTNLIISAGTAWAHVVTATDLIEDGVTGGAKDTMTFAAFVGASIHLVAYGQKWLVVSKNLVTIAAV